MQNIEYSNATRNLIMFQTYDAHGSIFIAERIFNTWTSNSSTNETIETNKPKESNYSMKHSALHKELAIEDGLKRPGSVPAIQFPHLKTVKWISPVNSQSSKSSISTSAISQISAFHQLIIIVTHSKILYRGCELMLSFLLILSSTMSKNSNGLAIFYRILNHSWCCLP